MTKPAMALLLWLASLAGVADPALAQVKSEQARPPAGAVKYEAVAPGLLGARIFATDALRDVSIEVKDYVLGPGQSAAELPTTGITVLEVKSGEVETTIDGQTARRGPGDFWVVRPGQKVAMKSLGGMVVLEAFIFTRK